MLQERPSIAPEMVCPAPRCRVAPTPCHTRLFAAPPKEHPGLSSGCFLLGFLYLTMPDYSLLEAFPTPTDSPFVIEHIAEEFTSVCPKTGHPDFGTVTVIFEPRGGKAGGVCVELKSLKMYLQSFRNEGIYYEAVTNAIRDDLHKLMNAKWLLVRTDWKGRGGIRSVIRATAGDVPSKWM